MFRPFFPLLLLVHGCVHFIGFHQLPVWRHSEGLFGALSWPWASALLLFGTSALFRLRRSPLWWAPAAAGVLLSQVLVARQWEQAKWGTIPNLAIALAVLYSFGQWRFRRSYDRARVALLRRTGALPAETIGERDLAPLPPPVQRYLRYVGVPGSAKLRSARIVLDGELRARGRDWFPFRSEQHNAFDSYERHFFMKARILGVDVPGYHAYKGSAASMQVRPGGLLPLVHETGAELFRAETVTLLNDICLLAPAALIDPRIRWEPIDEQSARAHFTNEGVTVSALLLFNDWGELINFISHDRIDVADGKSYRFSTPVSEYRYFGNFRLPGFGEAIWSYPGGDFTYGRLHVKEVRYNGQ
ncbi:MAG: hypothetical protein EOO11_04810 [Chitinophagaceae bacterium]|nr:MAG: hypothetical protein EOO11_04810 [Chitinophagaceae bacterium]